MTNPQVEIETRLRTAVQGFLDQHENSELLALKIPYAIVSRPGMTQQQVRNHLLAVALTVGLWLPVFAMVAILKSPKMYLIDASDPRGVWTQEFDPNE